MRTVATVESTVDLWRKELLELTNRNPLLNIGRSTGRTSTLQITVPDAAELFALLAGEKSRSLTIVGTEPPASINVTPNAAPDVDATPHLAKTDEVAQALPTVHESDPTLSSPPELRASALKTVRASLTQERADRVGRALQKKARVSEQEQGITTLFATFGVLKWRGQGEDTWRFAPLVLLPLRIEENLREGRSQIAGTGDDPEFNQTLVELLRRYHGVTLSVDVDEESDLSAVFDTVRQQTAQLRGWDVLPEVHLGTFQFHKLRMFRDLDEHKAVAASHPIIQALATEGATIGRLLEGIPSRDELDRAVPPQKSFTVLDADASQLWAVQAAVRGSNLIIQGPPGTGKSQTIANIIGECLAAGKTILFVSEKAAAIEVVHTRLKSCGLADFCLMLHSQKSNKLDVIEDLAARMAPMSVSDRSRQEDHALDQLGGVRGRLNAYAEALHRVHEPMGLSAFDVHGRLAELGSLPDLIVSLPQVASLTIKQMEGWRHLISEAARFAPVIAEGPNHVWAGFARTEIGLSDRATLRQLLRDTGDALTDAERLAQRLAEDLGMPQPTALPAITALHSVAEQIPVDRSLQAEWFDSDQASCAQSLAAEAARRTVRATALRTAVFETYSASILEAATPEVLAAYEAGWFSHLFSGTYKQARAQVRATATDGEQRPAAEELATLRQVVEINGHLAWFRKQDAALVGTLGVTLKATGLPGPLVLEERQVDIAAAIAISQQFDPQPVPATLVEALSQPGIGLQVAREREALAATLTRVRVHVGDLEGFFEPTALAVGVRLDSGPITAFRGWLEERLGRLDELDAWLRAMVVTKAIHDAGLDEVVQQLTQRTVATDRWVDTVTRRVLIQWLDHVHQQDTVLRLFNREIHQNEIDQFRNLDKQQLKMAVQRIRRLVAAKQNGVNAGFGGEPGFLQREANKRRRHLPLRRLFQKIPNLLPTLKPCLMMSPLSVAQFLPANLYHFDIVIFDEASQVRPHDAVGAIMRGDQLIVAGDRLQLPPSTFFDRTSPDTDDDASEDEDMLALESILDALNAKGMPPAPLLWHYRSRHEDLIAFSNHHIYDGRLITFPAPGVGRGPTSGVRLEFVPDGVYEVPRAGDLGGSEKVNRVEAHRIVELIIDHARTRPNESLGVVALGQRHRDLIDETLLAARRTRPDLEPFFAEDRPDPFFVKALEQVQGDERHVIMIGIGYGKDAKGKLNHNFGPINKDGGERRLNVLVTRARDQVIVASSIRASDIDLTKTQKRGPQLLRDYLDFAERGIVAIEQASTGGDGEYDSPFEASVDAALQQAGHTVRRQVGASSYRIDLAIVDPRQPGRYLLGIECDGATYHSSKTARDRDRLRQEILEGKGWTIYRVWSTDWIRNPQRELSRLTARIKELLAEPIEELERPPVRLTTTPEASEPTSPSPEPATASPEPTTAIVSPERTALLRTYRRAVISPRSRGDITAAPVFTVAEVVAACVAEEGPIHYELLSKRVREVWGHTRGGSRIAGHISLAIQQATRNGQIRKRGDFLWSPTDVGVTARGPDDHGEVRPIGQIATDELIIGMVLVLEKAFSLSGDDLVRQTAKVFGNQRAGPETQSRLKEVLRKAVVSGTVEQADDTYRLPKW